MHQHMERLAQNCIEAFDESSRKRTLPVEPTDGLDNAKRARLGADTPPLLKVPPLPEGPISYSQLYTLTEDIGLSSFDVKQLPPDLIVRIVAAVLERVDPNALTQATDVSALFMYCGVTAFTNIPRLFVAGIKLLLQDKPNRFRHRRKMKKMTMNLNTSQWMFLKRK